MARYLQQRLLSTLLTLFFITAVIFLLLSLVRGDATDMLRTSGTQLTPAEYEALRHSLGLDKPVWLRYVLWLRDTMRGNLGISVRYGVPVSEIIAQRLGCTIVLSGTGLFFAILWAVPIGVMAAYRPGQIWDHLSSVFASIGSTMPRFVMCIFGIYFFSYKLKLLPAMGMHTAGNSSFWDLLRHMILPASLITIGTMGFLIKHTRSALLEVLQEDYIKTARAKGLSEIEVIIKHGLRTALSPIVTQVALEIPSIVGGSAITEKIFGWPGIGSLMIEAISNRDQPLIMGVALVIAVVVLITNITLDIAYGLLDPRVTYQ